MGKHLPNRSPAAVGKAVGELLGETSGLSKGESDKLKEILHRFSDVISVGGRTNVLRHKIVMGDAPPVQSAGMETRLPKASPACQADLSGRTFCPDLQAGTHPLSMINC